MISLPVIKYVLTASVRDRVVLSIFLLMAVGASLAIFLGSAAVTESDQFALVFAAGGLRFAGAAGLVLFVVFFLRRSFDSRDVDYLLSRPVSRVSFILSHAAAFTLLALIVAFFITLTLCLMAPQAVGPGHFLWGLSLMAELTIMVNVALFFAMVLPNAAAGTLAVFGLYVLARIIGQILGIVESGLVQGGYEFLGGIMQVIALIVPRLDLMAQSSWLVYGAGEIGVVFILLQAAAFCALAITAAMVDLVRRQF